jgi:hypothetical protein
MMKSTTSQAHAPHAVDQELQALYVLMNIDPASPPADAMLIRHMREICAERNELKMQTTVLRRDVDRLVSYLEQLQYHIIAIEESRAWKLGLAIMRTARSVLGRSPARHGFVEIHRILTIYHHWKKAR